MRCFATCVLLPLALVLTLSGCGKGGAGQSAQELKQAFQVGEREAASTSASGLPSVKVQVEQVISAIDRKDYLGAVTGLEDLKARPDLTDQQYQAMANTMSRLQGQLAQEIANGNESAKQAGELLRAKNRR